MTITKRNHYNPCFWTAYWNDVYYNNKIKGTENSQKPREQFVYSLNLISEKVLTQKVENIFFEKSACIATLRQDEVLSYCERNFPEKLTSIIEYLKKDPSDTLIDFENHFTEYENMYKETLENTIISRRIPDISAKTYLSFFLYIQLIRNHNTLREAISLYKYFGKAKFELLLNIKHTMSDPEQLLRNILPFLSSKWTLYKANKHIFPLSDNPLLIRPLHIMVALAPDLMLEVDLKKTVSDKDVCEHKTGLMFYKYYEFKKRTIENSSREIIFGNEKLLLSWQKSRIFKNHLTRIKNAR